MLLLDTSHGAKGFIQYTSLPVIFELIIMLMENTDINSKNNYIHMSYKKKKKITITGFCCINLFKTIKQVSLT